MRTPPALLNNNLAQPSIHDSAFPQNNIPTEPIRSDGFHPCGSTEVDSFSFASSQSTSPASSWFFSPPYSTSDALYLPAGNDGWSWSDRTVALDLSAPLSIPSYADVRNAESTLPDSRYSKAAPVPSSTVSDESAYRTDRLRHLHRGLRAQISRPYTVLTRAKSGFSERPRSQFSPGTFYTSCKPNQSSKVRTVPNFLLRSPSRSYSPSPGPVTANASQQFTSSAISSNESSGMGDSQEHTESKSVLASHPSVGSSVSSPHSQHLPPSETRGHYYDSRPSTSRAEPSTRLKKEQEEATAPTVSAPPMPMEPIVSKTYTLEGNPRSGRQLRRMIGGDLRSTRLPSTFAKGVKPSYIITNQITLTPKAKEALRDEVAYPGSSIESLEALRHSHDPPKELIESGEAVRIHRSLQLGYYQSHWSRCVDGQKRSWCGICPQGKWLSMKRSQYMYHLQYEHGISCHSFVPFAPPTHLLKWNDVNSTTEGMCHQCSSWVPINYGPKRKTSFMAWFKHAHACHWRGAAGAAEAVDGADQS